MDNKLRQICLFLAAAAMVATVACKHKPAYSDIDANRRATSQNQNSEGQSTATPPGTDSPAPPAPAAPQPPAAPARTSSFKTPSFMDPVKGEINDLPNYPGASRANVRIGPVQEANVATLMLQTGDAMNQITAFYEKVIKNNRWTVIEKTIDPEISKWTLMKGADNSAKIEVKKDQAGRMTILLVRGEKLEEPGK